MNVPDETGHQVAGLIFVKECFREAQDPVEEMPLDIQDEFLLIARRANNPAAGQ